MARIYFDRVLDTSTTTGTGALTLAGPVDGFRRFSDVAATGDTFDYTIVAVDVNGVPTGAWECGRGTYSSANTLTRTTVQASSNAGAAVSFGAGTKYVMLTENAYSAKRGDMESIIIGCGDETTAITTGTAKVTFRMPYAFVVTEVRASVNTAPTGSTILIDINEAGVTILSTKLMIDATEKTSQTAATPYVISDANLADDAEISIDFDQVGSTIAGAGVKVTLIGYRA